jgi:GMP synthase (glutamine-hydrolysing)
VLISSSRACKMQAFRFKNRLYGFQYHVELTEAGIEAMLAQGKEDVTKVLGSDGESKIREATKKNYARYARLGDRVLKNYVQFLKAY